jgi:hypothetical protein
MKFTESKLEDVFIGLLQKEGYTHHLCNSLVYAMEYSSLKLKTFRNGR